MTPSFPVSLGTAFYMTRDTCDELEQQGFDILTYVDTSLRVTSISLPVSAGSKSLTALTQDITTTLVQAPDSIISVCSPKVTTKHAESSKTDSPQRKSKAEHAREGSEVADSPQKWPASLVPKCSNKEQQPHASAQLQVSQDGSLLMVSSTDASFLQPQSTSMLGKLTMANHHYSLSAGSTKSLGISYFLEPSHPQGFTSHPAAPTSHPS